MSNEHLQNVAAAFDRKATEYDAFGADHPNLDRIRGKVYDHIGRWHVPGASLLELNAGTGLDATRLVQRGYKIHATDLAPAMVAAIHDKIKQLPLQDVLSAEQCDFNQLRSMQKGQFDGVISNSGGLNCSSDLGPIVEQLPDLLKPGGVVTWVIMPHICPWELALLFKDFRVATRRLNRQGTVAHVEGVYFKTFYHSAAAVKKIFGPRFSPLQLEGISIVTPTADNKSFSKRHPKLYDKLVKVDDWLSLRAPFNGWGDFFALSLRFNG